MVCGIFFRSLLLLLLVLLLSLMCLWSLLLMLVAVASAVVLGGAIPLLACAETGALALPCECDFCFLFLGFFLFWSVLVR